MTVKRSVNFSAPYLGAVFHNHFNMPVQSGAAIRHQMEASQLTIDDELDTPWVVYEGH